MIAIQDIHELQSITMLKKDTQFLHKMIANESRNDKANITLIQRNQKFNDGQHIKYKTSNLLLY